MMSIRNAIPENPYFHIHNQKVDIFYRKKACTVPIEKIRKIYLSKRKFGNWVTITRVALLLPDNGYKFHIATDEKEIIFPVKSFEKQHFVQLISWIRNHAT